MAEVVLVKLYKEDDKNPYYLPINYTDLKNIKPDIELHSVEEVLGVNLDEIEDNKNRKETILKKEIIFETEDSMPPDSYMVEMTKECIDKKIINTGRNFHKVIHLVCSNSAHQTSLFLAERAFTDNKTSEKLVINFDQHYDYRCSPLPTIKLDCGNWANLLQGVDYIVIGTKRDDQALLFNTDSGTAPFGEGNFDFIRIHDKDALEEELVRITFNDKKKNFLEAYKEVLLDKFKQYNEIYITIDMDVFKGSDEAKGINRTDWSNGLMDKDTFEELLKLIPDEKIVGADITGFPPKYKCKSDEAIYKKTYSNYIGDIDNLVGLLQDKMKN